MRDLLNNIHPVTVIPPGTAPTDNTPIVSAIVDRLGFSSVTFVILTGTLADADATFTVKLEHGDAANLSDAEEVPDALMVGTEALAGFTHADDGKARKLGYVGGKRYQRLTVTPAGNASAANLGAVAILGHPVNAPTANPPA
ncbi:hypothetical protein [Azospirillum agricola]|uniref:hypothetical protein n=1 Tax=Azospirillum agricola TaxID=1720247 RepID=UPI000A0F0C12|nr:hypothetical protein [Azospirillum agricola]SMH60488.1 hypothetical protein SAMN02982994_5524 [Azospirillum lipoferum]